VNEFGSNVERHRRELVIHCYRMPGRRAVAPIALPRGYECLPRKYVCGVVPSIVRNISMKALTLL